ncbi:MAG: sigma-70 family RNA polymerase sigma factor, partial [Selenomonas sp.]|nr:sigma-70 family RNA polymerase sigma factor [Selenomonas sp.]
DYADLYQAIQKLRPRQKELLRKVFWENVRQTDIAKEEGVGKSAISQRLTTICNQLRKFLS